MRKIFHPNYETNINTGWQQVHIRASHVDKDDASTTPAGTHHHCFTKSSEAPSGQLFSQIEVLKRLCFLPSRRQRKQQSASCLRSLIASQEKVKPLYMYCVYTYIYIYIFKANLHQFITSPMLFYKSK